MSTNNATLTKAVLHLRESIDAEWLQNIAIEGKAGRTGATGPQGLKGKDGKTYTPILREVDGEVFVDFYTDEKVVVGTINIKGANGVDGVNGLNGADGKTYTPVLREEDGNVYLDFVEGDTTISGAVNLKGDKGEKGADGKSAYDIAVENGYEGTEAEYTELVTSVPEAVIAIEKAKNEAIEEIDSIDKADQIIFPCGVSIGSDEEKGRTEDGSQINIGQGSLAWGKGSIAIGKDAKALGPVNVVIGKECSVVRGGFVRNIIIGAESKASEVSDGIAIGVGHILTEEGEIAIGAGDNMTGGGEASEAAKANTIRVKGGVLTVGGKEIGGGGDITVDSSLSNTSTNPIQNQWLGKRMGATENNSVQIGYKAKAGKTSDQAVDGSGGDNGNQVAVGCNANGSNYGVAVGYDAQGCNHGTAVGHSANTNSVRGAVAVGHRASASLSTPIVIGGSQFANTAQITVSSDGTLKVGGKEISDNNGCCFSPVWNLDDDLAFNIQRDNTLYGSYISGDALETTLSMSAADGVIASGEACVVWVNIEVSNTLTTAPVITVPNTIQFMGDAPSFDIGTECMLALMSTDQGATWVANVQWEKDANGDLL